MDETNRADMLENGEKSFLNVPLVYEGRPIGFLVFIETEVERHFTDEERQLAAALGEQAAAAIHHAQLLRQTETQNRQLGLLLESTRAISSSVDLDEVLNTVARTAAELLGSQECQIQEYDAAANTVTPVTLWERDPYEGARESIGQVFSLDGNPEERAFLEAGEVLEQRYSDPDLPESTRGSFDKYGDRAYLNVPLMFSGEPVGVLVLVERTRERHWTPDEVGAGDGAGGAGRRRHRARPAVQAGPGPGGDRRAHRPLQPPPLLRAPGARGRARQALRHAGLAADDRPRRLQGVQRPQRPPGR